MIRHSAQPRHQYGHGALGTSDCPIKMFHSVSGNYTPGQAARMELISVTVERK